VKENRMNGIHDMGGTIGFGPVEPERDEPVFHEEWERRVFGMLVSVMSQGIIPSFDEFRHGVERMDPVHYISSSYYEHWLFAISKLLAEKGIITEDQLQERTDQLTREPGARPASSRENSRRLAALLRKAVQTGASAERRSDTAPRFKPGDQVLARNMHPAGHTRIPRYVRGKRGTIDRVHGVYAFPDTNAHGQGEQPQPVYSVRFEGRELWGDAAAPGSSLYIDLFEPYLEAV
jgi:nitrile hydratase